MASSVNASTDGRRSRKKLKSLLLSVAQLPLFEREELLTKSACVNHKEELKTFETALKGRTPLPNGPLKDKALPYCVAPHVRLARRGIFGGSSKPSLLRIQKALTNYAQRCTELGEVFMEPSFNDTDDLAIMQVKGEASEAGGKLRAFSIGTPHADTGVREIRELMGSGKAFAVLTPISLIPQIARGSNEGDMCW